MAENSKNTKTTSGSLAAVLLRAWWMLLGNVALLLMTIVIATEAQGALSWRDWLFVAIVSSIIAARYRDIRHHAGETSEGEPATMQHFKSHTVKLLLAAVLLLGGAHAAGVL